MSNPTEFIQTRFGDLAFVSDGPMDGPVLVLAQRFRGTIDDWDPHFIQALADTGRRVIRFDSAGVGRSTGVAPDTMPAMADVLLAFLDALELPQVDLLGWSMGGEVAQWVGVKAPERIRRMVLAGTSPGAVTEASADPGVPGHAYKDDIAAEDELWLFFTDAERSKTKGLKSVARTADARTSPPVSKEAVKAQTAASRSYGAGEDAMRSRLGQLTMPILVANGTDDRMLPAIGSFIIAAEAPDAKLVLYPGAGHGFLFQEVEGFVSEVERFLGATTDATWS